MALLGLLTTPIARWVAIALVLVGVVVWLRLDAASDARNAVAADAVRQERELQHEADKAARAAQHDGAAQRLRDGRF